MSIGQLQSMIASIRKWHAEDYVSSVEGPGAEFICAAQNRGTACSGPEIGQKQVDLFLCSRYKTSERVTTGFVQPARWSGMPMNQRVDIEVGPSAEDDVFVTDRTPMDIDNRDDRTSPTTTRAS